MMKRIGIYLREATGLHPVTSSKQRTACEPLVERLGGDVVSVHLDLPCSGVTLDRPALKALLADVDAGELDVVVVSDLTRIARNATMVAMICGRLREAGVELRVATSPDCDAAKTMLEPVELAYSRLVLERVFAEAAGGRSPRKIASGLNQDGIPRDKLIRTHDVRAVRAGYEAFGYTNVVVTVEAVDKDGVVHNWRAPEAA